MKRALVHRPEKLQLHRETLRTLEDRDLKGWFGGVSTISCELGSCFATCNTRNTCTSRLC